MSETPFWVKGRYRTNRARVSFDLPGPEFGVPDDGGEFVELWREWTRQAESAGPLLFAAS